MSQVDLRDSVRAAIEARCGGDTSQCSAIFAPSKRVFVEAPAGYGKTTVMTGRACWLLASDEVQPPKRILALTFSVAAARRMRADLGATMSAFSGPVAKLFEDSVMATNFHGFAWALLRRYWRSLLLPVNVDELSMVDDSHAVDELVSRGGKLFWDEKNVFSSFLRSLRNGQDEDLRHGIRPFNRIIKDRFASNGLLPYSGMISLAIELLADFPKLRPYLSAAYPVVLVDEAQDTNALCYIFLNGLLSDESGICMFGDPIQRVYGFIGAMEGLKAKASIDLGLLPLELEQNHRFSGGSIVGELGAAIRSNMKDAIASGTPRLPIFVGAAQQDEATAIVSKVATLAQGGGGRIAILVRKRGALANLITDELTKEGMSYFNGLFSDTDPEFIEFNALALSGITDAASGEKGVSRSAADKIIDSISDELLTGSRRFEYGRSYAMLLGALRKHLKNDCVAMDPSERFDYIVSIFSEGSLRRFSDYLDADISMMTVHSAKGLEWDTVFIPGVTRFDWPGRICSRCESAGMCSRSAYGCRIVDAKKMPDGLIEEMGLLYVGVTRARKAVYVSASMQRRTNYGNYQVACPSCLTSLPGIEPVSWTTMDGEGRLVAVWSASAIGARSGRWLWPDLAWREDAV